MLSYLNINIYTFPISYSFFFLMKKIIDKSHYWSTYCKYFTIDKYMSFKENFSLAIENAYHIKWITSCPWCDATSFFSFFFFEVRTINISFSNINVRWINNNIHNFEKVVPAVQKKKKKFPKQTIFKSKKY